MSIRVECEATCLPDEPGDSLTVSMVEKWLVPIPSDAYLTAVLKYVDQDAHMIGLTAKWSETRDE